MKNRNITICILIILVCILAMQIIIATHLTRIEQVLVSTGNLLVSQNDILNGNIRKIIDILGS